MRRTAALVALLALAGCAHAAPLAPRTAVGGAFEAAKAGGCTLETGVPIYRVFRGVKRAEVTPETFLKDLGDRFIPAAPRTHGGKGLVAYLPAVPPAAAPTGTPNEIAIVVYASEAVYQERRNTPEGKAYGDMHWELFDRPGTKSDTAIGWSKNGPALKAHVPVDMLEAATDWQCGHAVVYIGQRRTALTPVDFLARLSRHVALAKEKLTPLGMKGYIVAANDDQEIAWTSWKSKAAMARAFETEAGKAVAADGAEFMTNVMWTDAAPFKGAVSAGQAFNVSFQR